MFRISAIVPVLLAKSTDNILAPIGEHPFSSSFVQTDMKLSEKLHNAAAKAEEEAKKAQSAWEKSRKETDALLAKVHNEMVTLDDELTKTASKQKRDLTLLQESRAKEDKELEATEQKLKEMQKNTKISVPVPSSFISEDYLAPLRKAAQQAKEFAEKIKREAFGSKKTDTTSFLQAATSNRNSLAAEADRSLSSARQALSKLDADIAAQKRDLEVEADKAKRDEEALRAAAVGTPAASFIQVKASETLDPLSPQALAEWREKFQMELQKAREAAGIKTPFQSSFVETKVDATNEKLKEDERKVAKLEEAYNAQMAKLKEDNAGLMALAKSEITKAKEMKEKLESDMRSSSSLIQESNTFDVSKEEEHIRDLQNKWRKETEKLTAPYQPSEAENELNSLIEQQKAKEAAAETELERLKQKLNKDIAMMHHDMAQTRSSFVQEEEPSVVPVPAASADKSAKGLLEHAKELMKKLTQVTQKSVEPVEKVESKDEPIVATEKPVETPREEEKKDEVASATAANKEEEVKKVSSFAERRNSQASKDPAEMALQKAEADLQKLQEQLRQQTASLNSLSFSV